MISSLMNSFIILFVLITTIQCHNIKDLKRFQDSRSLGKKSSDQFRNYVSKMKHNTTVKSPSNRGTYHECVFYCNANFNFSSQLEIASQCPQRVTSYGCFMEILFSYDFQEYYLIFLTDGFEASPDSPDYGSIILQTVSLRYGGPEDMWYSMLLFCYEGDECDWNYAQQVINKLKSTNFQPLRNALSSSLYNSGGNSVSSCYAENLIVDCIDGICSSIFAETASLNRTCGFPFEPVIGIDINALRVFPGPSEFDEDDFIYNCNRNLCNSPSTDFLVQSTLRNYSSSLSVIDPSTSLTSTTTSTASATTTVTSCPSAGDSMISKKLSIKQSLVLIVAMIMLRKDREN